MSGLHSRKFNPQYLKNNIAKLDGALYYQLSSFMDQI